MSSLSNDEEAAVEAMLDADDPTLYRMWRYKALGQTLGQIGATPPSSTLRLQLNAEDYRIVVAAARDKGLSAHAYVRLCVARCVMGDYDLDPADVPSLSRDLKALTRD